MSGTQSLNKNVFEINYFQDKRVCRHSFGINIACWPCGVVVMFQAKKYIAYINILSINGVTNIHLSINKYYKDPFSMQELFGSEGVQQVYAQVTQWLSTLKEENRRKISWILYDNMCHLGKS